MLPQIEHRPPGLGKDKKENDREEIGRPEVTYIGSRKHAPTHTGKDLGRSQPDDDGKKNREIVKGIHTSLSLLGVASFRGRVHSI